MRILFNSRLYQDISGGVERMSLSLINEMVRRGHTVELVSLDTPGALAFYPISSNVLWTKIGIGDPSRRANLYQRIQRLLKMRQVIKRFNPDVCIGFQHGAFLTIRIAAIGTGTPVIAAERNAPDRFKYLKGSKRRIFEFQTFKFAKILTVQLNEYIERYPRYLQDKIAVIPNPVNIPEHRCDPIGLPNARKIILCVARLSYQKNQSVLIQAFSKLAKRFPEWDVEFLGEGEDRSFLVEEARLLGLAERVRFLGAKDDVASQYLAAQIFCLPSRWEGFPNALAEAMSFGLPSIGFQECAGTNSLITNNITGLLAIESTPESLANALAFLMQEPQARVSIGSAAREYVSHFSPQMIYDEWDRLFKSLTR